MGYAVETKRMGWHECPRLGQSTAQTADSEVGGGLMKLALTGMGITPIIAAAPAAGPLAPLVIAASLLPAVLPSISKLFKFGYDPQKLEDTAITEGAQVAMNRAWHALTGEALDGVNRTAQPGQYGDAGIAIFSPSAYPNVPKGPAGDPSVDVTGLIATVQQGLAQARSRLARPESSAGFDANAKRMLGLMQRVKEARAALGPFERARAAAEGAIPRTPAGGIDVPKILPWALGAFVAYKFIV